MQEDGKVTIPAKSIGMHVRQLGNFGLQIALPIQLNLEVVNSNGNIDASQVSGHSSFRTDRSEIAVENGQFEFNLDTKSGAIYLRGN